MAEWGVIALRTIGLFVLLLLAFPLLGRRSVASMNMLEVIISIVTATMIALIALKVVPNLAYGLLALFIWFAGILILQYFIQKSKWAQDRITGKEIIVIKNGKVLEENLQSARLTGEELLSQLRRKNIFSLADVEFALLEANGEITTLLKREKQPLTPNDLRVKVSVYQEPQTVILDGNIMDEPLTTAGLNREWLLNQLEQIGVTLDNVFIAQVDSMGELYVDLFDDTIQTPQPTTKQLLLSTLEKLEADFLSHELETENQEWKRNYQQYAQRIKEIIAKLEPYLST